MCYVQASLLYQIAMEDTFCIDLLQGSICSRVRSVPQVRTYPRFVCSLHICFCTKFCPYLKTLLVPKPTIIVYGTNVGVAWHSLLVLLMWAWPGSSLLVVLMWAWPGNYLWTNVGMAWQLYCGTNCGRGLAAHYLWY